MYIRSQNKEGLIKFNRVSIECLSNGYYISVPEVSIYHSVGNYKSKKRCIEILDELQTAIDRGLSTFDMPKE